MSRYINDYDAIYELKRAFPADDFGKIIRCISRTPTADVQEVKHGRWLMDSSGAEYCSECLRYPFDDGEYHISGWVSEYCPHCGAKMDGKETANEKD